MWAKIKEWGWAILGILIFGLSLVSVLARRKEKPTPDVGGISEEVIQQQNQSAAEIKEKQDGAVATVTKPIDTTPSKDIQEAIDRFNRS